MTVQPTNAVAYLLQLQAAEQQRTSAPGKGAAKQPVSQPQDIVQLSPAAQASLGDADHDGDSH
jgi:hypothetical protein